jgi:heptaprenyl diphosphate synthase
MTTYRIPEMIKRYTDYDMIQNHTELPEFPDFRTRLLYAFLNKNRLFTHRSELYSFVTSLVQLGLDTHDMVPVSDDRKEKLAARSRQLKVLAGDYFSSRFYHLLSQAGQIEVIRQLSAAICEVNRLKMNLYLLMKQVKLTAEEYISQTVDIKMQLYLSFTHLLEEMYASVWPEILRGFTRCEVLAQEIFRSETLENFRCSWAYWHVLQSGTKDEIRQLIGEETESGKLKSILMKYNVTAQLYQMLEEQLASLIAKINQLGSEKLIKELLQIGEPLLRYVSRPKVLEEI